MSAKRFLDAVGHIDDELVAEFVERDMEMGPSPTLRRAKRLWWVPIPAVAACLCVAIGLHHLAPLLLRDPFGDRPTDLLDPPVSGELVPWLPPDLGEDIPVVEVTAEVTQYPPYVEGYFGFVIPVTDRWYTLVDEDELRHAAPLPTEAYLPIYEEVNFFDEETLEAFIQKCLPTAGDMTGITDTDYEIQWSGTSGMITPSRYVANIGPEEVGQHITFTIQEGGALSFACPAEILTEKNRFPTLLKDSSDGEILTALDRGIDYLEKTLGKEFRDTDIEWRNIEYQGSGYLSSIHKLIVTLNGYPPEGSEEYPYSIASLPAFTVTLDYEYVNYAHSNELIFKKLTYSEPRNTADYTVTVGKAKTVPLTEAEELLKAGYVYGTTGCLLCREVGCDVDFSEYDSVGLVYKKSTAGHFLWSVPFYTFYKQVGDEYAAVYVPAVEVTGLEELFAEYTENHTHIATHTNN